MRLKIVRDTALRAEPKADAAQLAKLAAGTIVMQAGKPTGGWTKVKEISAAETTGWVRSADVEALDDVALEAVDVATLTALRGKAAATPVGDQAEQKPAPKTARGGIRESPFVFKKRGLSGRIATESAGADAAPDFDIDADVEIEPPEAAPPTAVPDQDIVDVSVFGPDVMPAGGQCLVQAFASLATQLDDVVARAREADADAKRRGIKTLNTKIGRGNTLQFIFEGQGLAADPDKQDIVWRGEPDCAQFIVSAPADAAGKTFYPRILVLHSAIPVGTITFALKVGTGAEKATAALRGDDAHRYRYAFLSYASPNRAEVIKRVQGIRVSGIDFFQDLLSLEPGDQWEKKLYEEIDKCDLFLLFWSTQAKNSCWVMKETAYALARQKKSADKIPRIVPVIIEGPPPPSRPDELRDIHFNDYLIYILAAIETQPPKPAG